MPNNQPPENEPAILYTPNPESEPIVVTSGGIDPSLYGLNASTTDNDDTPLLHDSTNPEYTSHLESDNRDDDKRRRRIWPAVVAAVAATALLVACLYNEDDGKDKTRNVTDNQEIIDALTVKTVTTDCVAVAKESSTAETYSTKSGKVVKFDIGALKTVGTGANQRRWSDAISTPLESDQSNNDAMTTEMQAAFCEDPLLGSTFANMIANMKVDGVKVVDLNKWLKPYEGDASVIADRAASFMPLRQGEKPSKADLEKAITKNKQWQAVAEKLGTLLERFQASGVGSDDTILNYHLNADGLMVAGLPDVSLNPEQYKATAFRLVLTKKTGGCFLEIGFNVGDKRPEQFGNCDLSNTVSLPLKFNDSQPTTPTTTGNKNPNLDYNRPQNPSPNVAPGSGGQPGPEGVITTTPTTSNSGNFTTTTTITVPGAGTPKDPAGECPIDVCG